VDGLFFTSLRPNASGQLVVSPAFGMGLTVTLGVGVDIGVASFGIEGGVHGQVTATWNDFDGTHRIYFDALARVVTKLGPQYLFDIEGSLDAFVRLYWSILGIPGGVTLIDQQIFSFKLDVLPPKVPAAVDGSGTLTLNMGPHAEDLQVPVTTDTAETFTVTQTGAGTELVDGKGN